MLITSPEHILNVLELTPFHITQCCYLKMFHHGGFLLFVPKRSHLRIELLGRSNVFSVSSV